MSSPNDLDRVLAELLHDGPSRAPDRPVQAAMEYARAHPRRPDPIAFLRSDPMAGHARSLVARPVLVLAVVGLLGAALAVAAIGSGRLPSVQPPIGPSPSSPIASPSVSASPTPVRSFPVAFTDEHDIRISVSVIDRSGTLEDARTAAAADPGPDPQATMPPGGVLVQNQDPRTLRVTWGDIACATTYELTIDLMGRAMTVSRPACSGDTLGASRVVLLVFANPIEAADVTAELVDAP